MKFLQATFLILCITNAIHSCSAAEKKEAAAQATALSAKDTQELKLYINRYEEFKKAVLDKNVNVQTAAQLLDTLQKTYAELPYNVQKILYGQIPDDQITYRLGVKPSEPTFFLQAYALLDRMQQKTEPPFPPFDDTRKYVSPASSMLLSKPTVITGQFTTPPKDLEISGVQESVDLWATHMQRKHTLQPLYLITNDPRLTNNFTKKRLLELAGKFRNYAVIEYLLQRAPQLNQVDKKGLLMRALDRDPQVLGLLRTYDLTANDLGDLKKDPRLQHLLFALPGGKENMDMVYDFLGKEKFHSILGIDANTSLVRFNQYPNILKKLLEEGWSINRVNENIFIFITQARKPCFELNFSTKEWDRRKLDLSLQYFLESPQLTNNLNLKEKLINKPNKHGFKPLCAAAEMEWVEGAKLLIKHGADCADEKYKDFLIPLIKEVEKSRAEEAGRVIRRILPETQQRLHPVPAKVKGYIAGEEQEFLPEPAESIVVTTGVEKVD